MTRGRKSRPKDTPTGANDKAKPQTGTRDGFADTLQPHAPIIKDDDGEVDVVPAIQGKTTLGPGDACTDADIAWDRDIRIMRRGNGYWVSIRRPNTKFKIFDGLTAANAISKAAIYMEMSDEDFKTALA